MALNMQPDSGLEPLSKRQRLCKAAALALAVLGLENMMNEYSGGRAVDTITPFCRAGPRRTAPRLPGIVLQPCEAICT